MNDKNKKTEPKTTGHKWDGIEEYDNHLPRWWLWIFLICVIFSVGYVIYYPAIPKLDMSGYTKGTAGWSQYNQLEDSQAEIKAVRAGYDKRIVAMSVQEIINQPDLQPYAVAGGKASFALNCVQCHGSGGEGGVGFPNLLDDEWIWGGTLDDIITTITHGIRDEENDEDTRIGNMPDFGNSEMLELTEINDVADYIISLTSKKAPTDAVKRGSLIFAENCTMCHGDNAQGNSEMGAPALNNHIWLYGGDKKSIVQTITTGRGGMMPSFNQRLDVNEIKKLAVYIHSLGGTQPSK